MVEGFLDFDAVIALCGDQQRRVLLAILVTEHRPLTVNDLTKAILARTHRTPVTEVSAEVLDRIRCSLHHRHLPQLESAGIVEYDRERRLVEPTPAFDELQPYLTSILEIDPELDVPVEL